ncbi:hypothetical protein P153DRAFT_381051 [Dothidotthia symphoricarpi CBS 119687]|uniref:Uncharacterized protein n=1 Tax=Dothidotthia symphoricarpi CBS 119687 TaxID=1392245 RepID=A0A6A6ATL0_9PLEO|nr:uncharacterized protein P153DRAFT_381051 [Dothidotthia symphoricarpi CBS 119687]KAF2133881.1 hypothetical protein P153DRAFT_381051 [Dothidotthia symphoricarpi CBS 119687]
MPSWEQIGTCSLHCLRHAGIEMPACQMNHIAPDDGFGINSWNCSRALGSPMNLSGQLATSTVTMSSLNFDKHLSEEGSFVGEINVDRFDNDTISNATPEEANEMWNNPW